MMRGARRPAAAAARPRRAARHRSRPAPRCPASRWSTSTGCRPSVARTHRRAQARGAPRRGHRRGGDPGVRGLARDARGAADDRRAARAGRRARRAAARRERAALGGLTERDRERVEAMLRAAVKRLLHEPTTRLRALDAEHRHARLSLLRELFGLEDAATRRRSGPPPRCASSARALAARHARQRAGARAGALGRGAAGRARSSWSRSPPRATCAARRRRQVALDRRARAGAARRRDRPRGPLRQGRARRARGGHRDRRGARRARTRATCSSAPRRSTRCPRARGSAPARCGGARSCSRCGPTSTSSSCAATSTRGCASWPTARSTRSCSPRPGSRRLGRDDVATAAPRRAGVRARPRARARCWSRRARATTARPRSTTPAARAALAAERRGRGALGASCHTAVGVHDDGATRARVRGPARRLGVARRRAPSGAADALADRLLAAGAAELLARAEAMVA